MADIIRTWPASVPGKTVAQIFAEQCPFESEYYFTLGRGKPQQTLDRLWFTYQGRILGSFAVDRVVRMDGSLPRLRRLDGEPSEWQIKPDAYVAICMNGCKRIRERVYMQGFRGWRYFDFDSYKLTMEARCRL